MFSRETAGRIAPATFEHDPKVFRYRHALQPSLLGFINTVTYWIPCTSMMLMPPVPKNTQPYLRHRVLALHGKEYYIPYKRSGAMKEFVDWLKEIEELAHDLYSESSLFFEADRPLSEFLARMARDEASHYHLMGSASEYLRRMKPPVASAIDLGREQTESIETTLKEAHGSLRQQVLSPERLLDTIVRAEWSEWNAIFVYVLNTLKKFDKRFQYMASIIQTHKSMIVSFLESHPKGGPFAERVRMLPKVWDARILIVEDSEPLCLLLKDLMADHGDVETAGNGKEALEKTRKCFFDVIIADIDMPVMNGLDFYKTAVEENPRLQGRFVFCSGLITEKIEAFLSENNLLYLKKPFQVQDIRNIIKQISTSAN